MRHQHRKLGGVILTLVLLAAVGAGAVTSIDKISFDSNSEFFDGDVFVIDYTSSFDTDKIDVFLSSSQLSDTADGETDQSLQLDVTAQDVAAEYSIQDSARRNVVDLTLVKERHDTHDDAEAWALNTCYDIDEDGAKEYYWKEVLAWDGKDVVGYCATISGIRATIGDIRNPREIFQSTWTLEADGETPQQCVLSNGDAGNGVMTNCGDHVKIRWQGNLDTGQTPPGVDDELAAHSNAYTNGWRVVSEVRYDQWDGDIRGLSSDYQDWAQGTIAKDTLQSDIDNAADRAVSPFSQSELHDAIVADSSVNTGKLKLVLDDVLAYPRFTIYVDGADFIRVTKTVGEPRIIKPVPAADVQEIGGGTVSFQVENVGTREGSFSSRITQCSSGFSFDDAQVTKTVAQGATASYKFGVSFTSTGTDAEVSGTCTIEAKDTGSGETDTATVSLTGVQSNECTPGERISGIKNGNPAIYECVDGFTTKLMEVCDDDEEVGTEGGTLTCVEKGGTVTKPGIISSLLGALGIPSTGPFLDALIPIIGKSVGSFVLAGILVGALLVAGTLFPPAVMFLNAMFGINLYNPRTALKIVALIGLIILFLFAGAAVIAADMLGVPA